MTTVRIEGFERRNYYREDEITGRREVTENVNVLTYIRDQIHHLGDNPYTKGLVTERPVNYDGINYYTEEELADAIKKMCEMLNE